MATFNAGAIEASLTLDRSRWKQELERTKREIEELERTVISIEVNADTDDALAELEFIGDYAEQMSDERVDIGVDIDSADAFAELERLEAEIDRVSLDTINIDVDVDNAEAAAELAILQAQIDAVDGQTIDIDVDYNRSAFSSLVGGADGGGGGHMGLLRILLVAIIALLPILSVAIGASLAAITALAGALAAAAAPALILAGGLALLIDRFKDTDPSDYTPGMQALADALEAMNDALDKVVPKIEDAGFDLMAASVQLVADIIPTLVPVFNAVAEMFTGLVGELRGWVESPEYAEMIDFFTGFGVDMLESFMRIMGNLIVFFGNLFSAMEPFIRDMIGGLEDLTGGWADWARNLEDNDSFQKWLERAAEYGPMVLDMLGSLLQALINIGEAIAPFAGPMLEGLTNFFDFIANMDPDILGPIVAGLAALYLGAQVVFPILSGIVGAFSVLGPILGAISGPVLIVAGLIALFAYAIYDAWQNSEEFRAAVIGTWEDIQATAMPIIEDIVNYFRENWPEIKRTVSETMESVRFAITNVMQFVQIQVGIILAAIRFLWENWGENILGIVGSVAGGIAGVISGLARIVGGIFGALVSLMKGDWSGAWENIRQVGSGAMQVISSLISGWSGIISNIFNMFGFDKIWSGIWSGIESTTRRVAGAIVGIISGISSAVNTVIGAINSIPNVPDPTPGFDIPGVPFLAKGGLAYSPTLAVVGDNPGPEPEVIAPLSKLRGMMGGAIDYDKMAQALASVLGGGVKVDIDARGADRDSVAAIPAALTFEMRRLGFGGRYNG